MTCSSCNFWISVGGREGKCSRLFVGGDERYSPRRASESCGNHVRVGTSNSIDSPSGYWRKPMDYR
jgi:hypothetical protein